MKWLSTVKSCPIHLVVNIVIRANQTAVITISTQFPKNLLHPFSSHLLHPTILSSGRTWSRAPQTEVVPSSRWSNFWVSRVTLSASTSTSTSRQPKKVLRSRIAATGLNLGKLLPSFFAYDCLTLARLLKQSLDLLYSYYYFFLY